MDRYQETFDTWDKVALLYQEKFMDLDLYNGSYDFICGALKPHSAVLEIGCGPGNITKYLLSKRPDLNISCIDISPNMVELAKRNNPAASVDIMDAREIDKINTTFDGIVCGFCLPYMSPEDCKKLMEDSYHLLNKEGLIYVSFVDGDPANSGYRHSSTGDRTYFYFHRLSGMQDQLSGNNYEVIKTFTVEYDLSATQKETHIILIAKKG